MIEKIEAKKISKRNQENVWGEIELCETNRMKA